MFARGLLFAVTILIVCTFGSSRTQQTTVTTLDHLTQAASPSPTATPTRPIRGPISPGGGGVRARFAGIWVLDKSKSEGLTSRLLNADRVVWIVKQDDKQISIEQQITGGEAPAGGPGQTSAGGRSGPGFNRSFNPSVYKLDGSETTVEMGGQVKSTSKATWLGDSLDLVRKSTLMRTEGEVTYSETQTLEMSKDGKVLKVKVQRESPSGTTTLSLVFNKGA